MRVLKLPLTETSFFILLSLVTPKHGYAIIKEVDQMSDGRVKLAAFIPLFFGCVYAYAGIQIAQAKQLGVHQTLEDAVYSAHAAEHRGARVKLVYINRAEPCFPYGRLPFVWCVTSSVFYDRPPEGSERSVQGGYSTYYHLREGWVFMQEAIPGLTGVIMERFGMVK